MPSHSSKKKSATEKTPVAPGRQRTQTTKQQLLRKFCIALPSLWNLLIFLLEQEKASKAQAAKDKAYQEALRSQQRQEENIGFQKLPAQAPPPSQGNWDDPESEDNEDDPQAVQVDGAVCYLFFIIYFD
jgi:type IV secretory pathway VirB9-like protein